MILASPAGMTWTNITCTTQVDGRCFSLIGKVLVAKLTHRGANKSTQKMHVWQFLLLYSALLLGVCCAMRKQGVAVRGVLKCGAVPAKNAKVRIVDLDTGPDPDDTLDEKRTDHVGRFEVSGTTHEMTSIDPVLYIWHDCLDEQHPCLRKMKFVIPKKFIHNGDPKPEQWVDIGVLNLEGSFDNEGRECIN
nr:Transthyretin domain containing protein [Haemonchus contortus]